MDRLRLGIVGCTGRTGSAVLRQAVNQPNEYQVVAALTMRSDPHIGQDASTLIGADSLHLKVSDVCIDPLDVVVDFSSPAGLEYWANWCGANGVPLVSGTTGLEPAHEQLLQDTAARVPVLWSPNMSIGVNALLQLVREAAGRLDEGWDAEIEEVHHRHKVDAPSGTAKAIYEAICDARHRDRDVTGVYGRVGQCGPRKTGEIGIHAVRMGDVIGEHTVHFATTGEMLTLGHRAFSRDTFATGALRAARWIVGKPPALYRMRDMLFGPSA